MTKSRNATPEAIDLETKKREVRGLISDLNKTKGEAKTLLAELREFVCSVGEDMTREFHAVIQVAVDKKLDEFSQNMMSLHKSQTGEIYSKVEEFRNQVIPATGVVDGPTLIIAFASFLGYNLTLSDLPKTDLPTAAPADVTHLMQETSYMQVDKVRPIGATNPPKKHRK